MGFEFKVWKTMVGYITISFQNRGKYRLREFLIFFLSIIGARMMAIQEGIRLNILVVQEA